MPKYNHLIIPPGIFTAAILLHLVFCLRGYPQENSNTEAEVQLIKWAAADCDNTYDPDYIQNRISEMDTVNGVTVITVNFTMNCCADFEPQIKFSQTKLILLPNEQYQGGPCDCNCCYSIQYEISGLIGKTYDIYFRERQVILSDDLYHVFEPTFELYKGEKINRTNKYGFREGVWILFYESGEERMIGKLPDKVSHPKVDPLWAKGYHLSGALASFRRKDSSEYWFEDGELKSQTLKYKVGDTTYNRGFKKFDDRSLKREWYEKSYPEKVEYKGQYALTLTEVFYENKYYENGEKKYVYGRDTSYSWYESGQIKEKKYNSGWMKYDKEGFLIKRIYFWKVKVPKSSTKLDHSLYVDFYQSGNIKQIHFSRDKLLNNGVSIGIGSYYYWIWDEDMKLIQSPEKWNEELPWEKFDEIKVPTIGER